MKPQGALTPDFVISCSSKYSQSLILYVFREFILPQKQKPPVAEAAKPQGTLAPGFVIPCSPKYSSSLILYVFREAIITQLQRERKIVPCAEDFILVGLPAGHTRAYVFSPSPSPPF